MTVTYAEFPLIPEVRQTSALGLRSMTFESHSRTHIVQFPDYYVCALQNETLNFPVLSTVWFGEPKNLFAVLALSQSFGVGFLHSGGFRGSPYF